MAGEPNGRRERTPDGDTVVITRRLPHPIDVVWAWLTESDKLGVWIGEWDGDPSTGVVSFRMTAEAADASAEPVTIDECMPPTRFRIRVSGGGGDPWALGVDLGDDETPDRDTASTTVLFSQRIDDEAALADIGPGWEYYLDRLDAALAGRDVSEVDFERDYHPAMSEYYRALAAG